MTREELIESCLQIVPKTERKTVMVVVKSLGLPETLYFVAREAFLHKIPESIHTERVRTALSQLLHDGYFTLDD